MKNIFKIFCNIFILKLFNFLKPKNLLFSPTPQFYLILIILFAILFKMDGIKISAKTAYLHYYHLAILVVSIFQIYLVLFHRSLYN